MIKVKYVAFVNDNFINLLDIKKDCIYQQKFNYLKQDEIIDESKFYFEFNSFIRKNKIKISLFGHKLILIINNINHLQLKTFNAIFKDYFSKIEYKNINEFLILNKTTAIINILETYIDYYYIKKNEIQSIRINKNIFNNNEFKIINHLVNMIFNPKKIVIFGTDKIIPKITKKINKELNIECTYPEDYNNYILNEYKKKEIAQMKR